MMTNYVNFPSEIEIISQLLNFFKLGGIVFLIDCLSSCKLFSVMYNQALCELQNSHKSSYVDLAF